jgi:hypothetical protein
MEELVDTAKVLKELALDPFEDDLDIPTFMRK